MEYMKAGIDIKYAWKRMEGNRDGKKRGFNGKHVERIVRRNTGIFFHAYLMSFPAFMYSIFKSLRYF